jgi:hypothetical protein
MSASARNFEHAAQVQFVRAEKAEQKAGDIQHALNLLLNLGFERFHMGSTPDGAVHYFELGTVRNLPAADGRDLPACRGKTRARGIVLWSLPGNLGPGNKLRNLLDQAIAKIPRKQSFMVVGDPANNR